MNKSDDKKLENDETVTDESSGVSLVPLYSPLDVSKGLQAYRRENVILYTVRGEPSKIQELIDELDGRGVNDVVALVSHRTDDKDSEELADAVVEPSPEEGGDEER